jgi:hypothetical protein
MQFNLRAASGTADEMRIEHTRRVLRYFERGGDIVSLHGSAQLRGDDLRLTPIKGFIGSNSNIAA